jgi:hypothetical protein
MKTVDSSRSPPKSQLATANDRKYAGNAPKGVAFPGNSGVLGAVEGAQRKDFPKILPAERLADQKIKEEARCWTLAGAHHLQAITFLAD